MLRIARRDEASLVILYDRYAPLLLGLALRILGDRGEAEDALQSVFVRVWRDASRYDGSKASVRVWLLSCVRHAAIDQVRRRGVHDKAARQAAQENPRASGADDLPPVDEEQKRVIQAIQALPQDQREVIDLAYFQGLSQSRIAARLELPLGTVKTRIRLGMARLRDALSGFAKEQK